MKRLLGTVVVALLWCSIASAEQPRPFSFDSAIPPVSDFSLAETTSAASSTTERLRQLEEETQALREEMRRLREESQAAPRIAAGEVRLEAPQAPADDADYFTLDDLKAEMKDLAWTKGDFTIVPYGALWASMIYETERTNPGAYTLWVFSADDQGEDHFLIDARRTRLGLDVSGPRIPFLWCAESGGNVEIDFHGNFVTENKAGVLLRHAYWEAHNESFKILVGQTWDVISPLYPSMLMYSVGWDGGNIGYRRAQIRLDRYFACSNTCLLTAQLSLNQDIVPDFTTVPGVSRESSDWPLIEARLAATLGYRGKNCRPIVLGVSGHIGETGFDISDALPDALNPLGLPPQDDLRVKTWSLNVDASIPLTERLTLKGEAFTGANLSAFLGGIGQGVCVCTRTPIRSRGGWFDVGYDWTDRLHTHAGYGLDDPIQRDSFLGRSYNQFFFANVSYDVTSQFDVGLEVSSWKTLFTERRPGFAEPRPGESVRFEFVAKYGF